MSASARQSRATLTRSQFAGRSGGGRPPRREGREGERAAWGRSGQRRADPGAPPAPDPPSLCLQGEAGEPGPKGQVSGVPVTPSPCPASGAASSHSHLRPPAPTARGPRRTWLPGPQRRCGRPRGAGLPRAPRPSGTGWRPRRARPARETGRGGELAPEMGRGLVGNLLGGCLPPRAGSSRRKPLAPASEPRGGEGGCGRGRGDFSQRLKILRGRKWQPARGFFPKGLCFQGPDASDRHIVDVVMKMVQGEGRGQQLLLPRHPGPRPFRSLPQGALPGRLESWVLIQLYLQGAGALDTPHPLWTFDLRRKV